MQVHGAVKVLMEKTPVPTPYPRARAPWDVDHLFNQLKDDVRRRANDILDLDMRPYKVCPDTKETLDDEPAAEDFDRVLSVFEDDMKWFIEDSIDFIEEHHGEQQMPDPEIYRDFLVRVMETRLRAFNTRKDKSPFMDDRSLEIDKDIVLKAPFVRFDRLHLFTEEDALLDRVPNDENLKWFMDMRHLATDEKLLKDLRHLPQACAACIPLIQCIIRMI